VWSTCCSDVLLTVLILVHHGTQDNVIQHNNSQHNSIQNNNKLNMTVSRMTLSVMVECCYSVMLHIVMLNDIVLNVTNKPFMQNIINSECHTNPFMLSVNVVYVDMLIVVAQILMPRHLSRYIEQRPNSTLS